MSGSLGPQPVFRVVYRQYQCVRGRIQVQADNVGRLGAEFRIGADAPAASPLEADIVPAENAPYLILTDT